MVDNRDEGTIGNHNSGLQFGVLLVVQGSTVRYVLGNAVGQQLLRPTTTTGVLQYYQQHAALSTTTTAKRDLLDSCRRFPGRTLLRDSRPQQRISMSVQEIKSILTVTNSIVFIYTALLPVVSSGALWSMSPAVGATYLRAISG